MFVVCDYYEDVQKKFEELTKYKKLEEAVKDCKQRAVAFKNENSNDIKLLDYERMYKSEKLVYGVYCIDRENNSLVKEIRVYEE